MLCIHRLEYDLERKPWTILLSGFLKKKLNNKNCWHCKRWNLIVIDFVCSLRRRHAGYFTIRRWSHYFRFPDYDARHWYIFVFGSSFNAWLCYSSDSWPDLQNATTPKGHGLCIHPYQRKRYWSDIHRWKWLHKETGNWSLIYKSSSELMSVLLQTYPVRFLI